MDCRERRLCIIRSRNQRLNCRLSRVERHDGKLVFERHSCALDPLYG
jgi:hypothetical protein